MTQLLTDEGAYQLQQYLIARPPKWEVWGNRNEEPHSKVSPSGYYKCPHEVNSYWETHQTSYAADRGTTLHDHCGPLIMEALFGPDPQGTRYQIERRYRVDIHCPLCDTVFEFAGSIDLYDTVYKWLIDLKFTGSKYFKPEVYAPQVSGYAMLREKGVWWDNVRWRVPENEKVNHVNILWFKVDRPGNPDFLYPRDYAVEPLPMKEVIRLASEYHRAKAHGEIYYRPTESCRWCSNTDCPHKK